MTTLQNDPRAACRGHDPAYWFPEGHKHNNTPAAIEAKRICHSCPLEAACLQYALDMERRMNVQGRAGIWGGKDEVERYELSCLANSRPLLGCGEPTQNASYKRHLHAGETCPICRPRANRKRAVA